MRLHANSPPVLLCVHAPFAGGFEAPQGRRLAHVQYKAQPGGSPDAHRPSERQRGAEHKTMRVRTHAGGLGWRMPNVCKVRWAWLSRHLIVGMFRIAFFSMLRFMQR